jgi:general nucleoside transport system permease protein
MTARRFLHFIENLLAAGVARGTPLLFASVGEVLAERSGVLNLGVEGMMLMGAAVGCGVAHLCQSPLLGLLAAMAAAAGLALLHALITVGLVGDQVVSGLGLGFFGSGLASVIGAPFVGVGGAPRLGAVRIQRLAALPLLGPALFDQNVIVYVGFALLPLAALYLNRSRWGLKLRAVGENPAAADVQGISVAAVRTAHVVAGGALAGLAGASLSLGVTPGWVDGMTAGQGWIAVGLVIFAAWSPLRAGLGSYLFGTIRRLPLDLQGVEGLPLLRNPNLGYFLDMLPYLFTIAVLWATAGRRSRSGGSTARADGAPGSLGLPFIRGERGR